MLIWQLTSIIGILVIIRWIGFYPEYLIKFSRVEGFRVESLFDPSCKLLACFLIDLIQSSLVHRAIHDFSEIERVHISYSGSTHRGFTYVPQCAGFILYLMELKQTGSDEMSAFIIDICTLWEISCLISLAFIFIWDIMTLLKRSETIQVIMYLWCCIISRLFKVLLLLLLLCIIMIARSRKQFWSWEATWTYTFRIIWIHFVSVSI